MKKLQKVINVFKKIWKFITQEPKERTDEEWEEYFAILESLKRSRELNERRNRKHRNRNPYTTMHRRTKRRYCR